MIPPSEIAPEIPSPIDFDDPAQARAWVDATVAKRPWRLRFFAAFASALNAHFNRPIRVAELGSGPGHLAKAIIHGCKVSSYTAIDFSAAMHDLAREHLGESSGQVHFLRRDFRRDDWAEGLGPLDAIVTTQAAHEVRHKTRQPALLKDIHAAIENGGLLLFCDHYSEAGSTKDSGLFLTHEEQPALLENAGFRQVEQLLDEGGMALYRAYKS
jgi:SAM-dependent methyltransferase